MLTSLITKEYPPEVYGGAGVHIEKLSQALKKITEVEVYCFGEPRNTPNVYNFPVPQKYQDTNPAIQTLAVDCEIANSINPNSDVFHSHTWYANYAGILSARLYHHPHVLTAHSLEPLRPWKKEQLNQGYEISSQVEKLAYQSADGIIAVSNAMKTDILDIYGDIISTDKIKTIYNGVDLNDFHEANFEHQENETIASELGINPEAITITFMGRITRQKGLSLLLEAIKKVTTPNLQFVIAASSPDTKELAQEVSTKISELQKSFNLIWLDFMLSDRQKNAILGISDIFVCPSIYEPLGIVNLEAMACHLPVIASKTGGIPEVVLNQETGILIDLGEQNPINYEPLNLSQVADSFAQAIDQLANDENLLKDFGTKGFLRAKDKFSWDLIAQETLNFYQSL